MNSESAVSPETALITLPSRPQKRFSAQHSRDKQGNLSTHQCAISLSIGESNHSLVRHLPAPQGRAGLSHQHESGVVSQGNCGGDVYGAVDQQTRDCDRSGTGGERGREQPCAARGHRDGDRVGRRHARQVARTHEGREHVASAPELDA